MAAKGNAYNCILCTAHLRAVAAEWKYDWGGGGGGMLVWEAATQPIIRAKRLHVKVKNWGGPKPPRFRRPCLRDSKWYMHYRLCTCTKSKY